MISKLSYFKDLGVDAIWLSPVYPSPLIDMGYDISDYTDIDARFGTLGDMLTLISKAHEMGIRVLMDLVINHTSNQHKWFKESKKSKDGEFADFYIWKDPKISKDEEGKEKKGPPNNWGSFFGGPAWKYVKERDQYYMHLFDYRQPDLNWESPKTRQKIYDDAIRFWLDRGVDGFRVDTAGIYSKDQKFEDGEVDPKSRFGKEFGTPFQAVVNGPRIHEFWQEIRKGATSKYGDVLMVGELGPIGKEEIMKYVGRNRKELSMVFDFEMSTIAETEMAGGFEKLAQWDLPMLKAAVGRTQSLIAEKGGWASVFAENHDLPRSVSRYGSGSVTRKGEGDDHADGKYLERSAKVLCLLLTTLSGNLYMYEGQEIGMTNIPKNWSLDDLMDIASIQYYEKMVKEHPGDKDFLGKVWEGICANSRDNARTPVQWSAATNAGFSQEKPWMKVNENYKKINVEEQSSREDSVWGFWKKMLKIRKNNAEVLINGSYHVHDEKNEKTFIFEKRTEDGKKAVVITNWTDEEVEFKLPETEGKMELVMSNVSKPSEKLGAWEGRLYSTG